MLQQLVQPTRRTDEPLVPRIRQDKFGVRQAGIRFRDQAKVQNMKLFMEWEEARQKQAKPIVSVVDQLAGTIAGQQLPPQLLLQLPPPQPLPQLQPQNAAAVQQVTPPPDVALTAVVAMNMQQAETEKDTGDDLMGDGDGAQGQANKADVELEQA
ncbi:MAG: hypothetical protein GY835_08790 [bacterium]|nr:hypothetical protein [bacterium]